MCVRQPSTLTSTLLYRHTHAHTCTNTHTRLHNHTRKHTHAHTHARIISKVPKGLKSLPVQQRNTMQRRAYRSTTDDVRLERTGMATFPSMTSMSSVYQRSVRVGERCSITVHPPVRFSRKQRQSHKRPLCVLFFKIREIPK